MQQQMSILNLLSGKTSQELSAAMEEMTSKQSSRRSAISVSREFQFLDLRGGYGNLLGAYWATATALPGVSMTLNTGECPSVVRESTLSQILEANAPERYYLSPTACQGILNRAKKRGKELPVMLREALEEVLSLSKSAPANRGAARGYCPVTTEPSPSQPATARRSPTAYALQGHVIDRESSQSGRGWTDDNAYTLTSTDRDAVAYSVDNVGIKEIYEGGVEQK